MLSFTRLILCWYMINQSVFSVNKVIMPVLSKLAPCIGINQTSPTP